MAQPTVPFVEGYVPGTPKPKKVKTWTEELNDIGNFLLGPHGQQLFGGLEAAAEFTPGAAIRDTMDASKTVSEGVMNLNPWETGMGLAGILMGILPGKSPAKEFPLIHGSQHLFDPIGNEKYGRFDLGKALTGEGTNYEGKGIYATEPLAKGVATTYAMMGPEEPIVKIAGKSTDQILQKATSEQLLDYNTFADRKNAIQELTNFLHKRLPANKKTDISPYLAEFNQFLENRAADPNWAEYVGNVENQLDFLRSFEGLPAQLLEPGGYIYDFLVHDTPDNFINMHLPLQYQDDKIIQAVDTWIKEMPISKKQLRDFMPIDGKVTEQALRDNLRRKFIDNEYNIPKEEMSAILQNEYLNEHMDIIKDQGVLGQKWFAATPEGRKARKDVNRLFTELGDLNSTEVGDEVSGFFSRDSILSEIKKLTDQIESMPLSNENISKMFENQTKINMLNKRLEDLVSPDGTEEALFKIYNDPKVMYNYTINDPSKTTITGRKFYPK